MSRCSLCDCDLTAEDMPYLIEKAFRDGETMFEHALCLQCHFQCMEEMSEESLNNIQTYFSDRTDPVNRPALLLEQFGTDHKRWLGKCMVKGYPIEECGEYQIYGFCSGTNLVFSGAPYMICGEVVEDILELLSNETLGTLADLSDRLFGIDAPKDLLVF